MNYEKKYKEALERARAINSGETTGAFGETVCEFIFPELKESEDERVRKKLIDLIYKVYANTSYITCVEHEDMLAWLEKQGDFKSSKWTEGDVVRHGGVLALVINGRKAMKSNCEQITIQYSDEWIKTGTKERKYFFEELEKQGERNLIMEKSPQLGEQKPADKVEPKDYNSIDPHFGKPAGKVEPNFKIEKDKWYVCTQTFVLRGKEVIIKGQTYQAEKDNVIKGEDGCLFVDRHDGKASDYLRSWTFQDAKDGDILWHSDSASNGIFIFKEIRHDGKVLCYCDYDSEDHFCLGEHHTCCWTDAKILHPATKEQRDTLEKAMTDAGYIFDFESKELKKLGQSEVTKMSDQEEKAEIPFGAKDSELQEATYFIPKGFHAEIDDDKVVIKKDEKPTAWSEEDENILEAITYTVKNSGYSHCIGVSIKVMIDWLKSLQQRIGG